MSGTSVVNWKFSLAISPPRWLWKAQRRVYRKDELGAAGRIYNATSYVHMEIVCDDDNLNKLVGRRTGALTPGADGRRDAVFGEVYFRVPAGARLYADKPAGNITVPTTAVAETTTTELIIGMRYASGDGTAAKLVRKVQ